MGEKSINKKMQGVLNKHLKKAFPKKTLVKFVYDEKKKNIIRIDVLKNENKLISFSNDYVMISDILVRGLWSKLIYYKKITAVKTFLGEDSIIISMDDDSETIIRSELIEKIPFIAMVQEIIALQKEIKKTSSHEKNKVKLSKIQKEQCSSIIHSASAAAGAVGAGAAQVPLSDTAVITPIQITMITALGKVFNVNLTEGMAKGIISSCAMAFIGRGVSQIVIGWIPGAGNIVNTATAVGLTEVIGWCAVKHFSEDRYKLNWKEEVWAEAGSVFSEKFDQQREEFDRETENLIKYYEDIIDTYKEEIEIIKSDIEK